MPHPEAADRVADRGADRATHHATPPPSAGPPSDAYQALNVLTPAMIEDGAVAFAQAGPEAGLAYFDDAIAADPDQGLYHLGRACMLAHQGRYQDAWPGLELRRWFPHGSPGPAREWRGEALPAGATVLVLEDEGYGDSVQMARYLPLVAALGVRVVLACRAPLVPLMRRLAGVEVVEAGAELPRFDVWSHLLSLPGIFGTTLDTVPSRDGYLTAAPNRAAAWRAWLPDGVRVGIVWECGHPEYCGPMRSIPPAYLASLLDTPGVNFVALQHGATLPMELARPNVIDAGRHLHDFGETAAALATLDVLITPDTVTANIAGAMGLPAIVLLPYASDWRWRLASDGMGAWFTSPVVEQQATPGDWSGVVTEAAGVLREFVKRCAE